LVYISFAAITNFLKEKKTNKLYIIYVSALFIVLFSNNCVHIWELFLVAGHLNCENKPKRQYIIENGVYDDDDKLCNMHIPKNKVICKLKLIWFYIKNMFEWDNFNLIKYFMFKLSPKNTTLLNLLRENFNIYCSTCNSVRWIP
jgi:hypothetical protein